MVVELGCGGVSVEIMSGAKVLIGESGIITVVFFSDGAWAWCDGMGLMYMMEGIAAEGDKFSWVWDRLVFSLSLTCCCSLLCCAVLRLGYYY